MSFSIRGLKLGVGPREELQEESMKQSENEANLKSQNPELLSGARIEITEFQGDGLILERLRELGLRKGSRLHYVRQAPFGGPFLFQLPTTLLALREEELQCLKFKVL
jgi:Fe2+ transport system protein FeoA